MRARAQQLIPLAVFDQFVIVPGDILGAGDDLLDLQHVVKHQAGVAVDVADDMGVGSAVDGLRECPGLDPGLDLGQGSDRQESQIWRSSLHRIQQDLAFEIAAENMLFMRREIFEVFGITQHIHFLRAPKES